MHTKVNSSKNYQNTKNFKTTKYDKSYRLNESPQKKFLKNIQQKDNY